ncbi:GntR family transcriptional regulator [Microbacterium phyllosphaerae]
MARTTLQASVEAQIRDAIMDGTLRPGEVLSNARLQAWLGVSGQPIRIALGHLARIGLIEQAPQSFTRVASPNPAERVAVLHAVGALVGGIARVTVPTLSHSEHAALVRLAILLEEAVVRRDKTEHGRIAREVTQVFLRSCPNAVLRDSTYEILEGLWFQLSATRAESGIDWPALSETYPRFRDALLRRDAVETELAIERAYGLPVAKYSR